MAHVRHRPDTGALHGGECFLLQLQKGTNTWHHKPVLGPAAKQYYYDWMRIWVVGRRGDPPGLPLGGANRPISQWEQVALSLMPAAREPVRRHDLPDGDLSEREWPDADDEDDDDKEQADQDGGEPSSFMQRRPPLQGGSSSSADVVPPGCEAMAMVRRTLRRLIATLAATEAAALQQQVETSCSFLTHRSLLKRGEGTERPSGPDTPMALGKSSANSASLGGDRPTT